MKMSAALLLVALTLWTAESQGALPTRRVLDCPRKEPYQLQSRGPAPDLEKYSCQKGCRPDVMSKLTQYYGHLFKSSDEISQLNHCEETQSKRSTDNDRCCPTKSDFETVGYGECYPYDYQTNGLCCVVSLPNKYQLAHVGRCQNSGSGCGRYGKCTQRYKYVTFLCMRQNWHLFDFPFDFRQFRVESHCS